MLKIILTQNRMVLIAGAVALVFLLVWFFIYLPSKERIENLEAEFNEIYGHVRRIEDIILTAKTVDEGMLLLQQRDEAVGSKFPEEEESCLKMLSSLARKSNINIVSLKPKEKVPFIVKGGRPTEIFGKVCQSVFVAMSIRSTYEDFLRYIEILKESFPAHFTVERLTMRLVGSGKGSYLLDINCGINFYLLSQK